MKVNLVCSRMVLMLVRYLGSYSCWESQTINQNFGKNIVVVKEVNATSWSLPSASQHLVPIVFTKQDAEDIVYPDDDALAITLKIRANRVAWTLVYMGSSVYIIFKDVLN